MVLGLLHPRDYNHICKEGMTNPILEIRKLKLSKMKRNSLEIPRFTEQDQDSEPFGFDSKVLSSTAHCVQEATKLQKRPRGRAGPRPHMWKVDL